MNINKIYSKMEEKQTCPTDVNRIIGVVNGKFYMINFMTGVLSNLTWGAYKYVRDTWKANANFLRALGYDEYS